MGDTKINVADDGVMPPGGWKTGVYAIVNMANGKYYVGSSTQSLDGRMSGHRKELRKGRHGNEHLQSAWNKYGGESFEFVVLERCRPSRCVIREQVWLDKTRPYERDRGYNISPTAANCRGVKHTERSKASYRVSNQISAKYTRGIPRSPEVRAKISAALTGRKLSTEHKAKIGYASRNRSNETLAKIGAASRNISDATRAKLAEAARRKVWTDEARAKKGRATSAWASNPEVRARLSANAKEQWRKRKAAGLTGTLGSELRRDVVVTAGTATP